MVTLLKDHAAELGVTAAAAQLEATAARTAEQLGRGASLALKSASREGDTLAIQLQVSPATGHKFPTSFPSRRAWLHVTVTDAAGQVVFESGRPESDGSIQGNAADADPGAYEPHYDVINAADQVQIYEPIMGDTEGKVTYTLLRAATYLKDNRLLPGGADKAKLPPEIAVKGEAASDTNFVGGGDQITYRVDVSSAKGPFTVQAELLYQPLVVPFRAGHAGGQRRERPGVRRLLRRGRSHAGPRRSCGADAGTVVITAKDSLSPASPRKNSSLVAPRHTQRTCGRTVAFQRPVRPLRLVEKRTKISATASSAGNPFPAW